MAKYELAWWKARSCHEPSLLTIMLADLFQLQFHVPRKVALQAAELKTQAIRAYDLAMSSKSTRNKKNDEKLFEQAKELLRQHFAILLTCSVSAEEC